MNMTSVDRRKDTLRALDKKPDANAHIFVSSLGLARLCCLLSDIFCGVAWGGGGGGGDNATKECC